MCKMRDEILFCSEVKCILYQLLSLAVRTFHCQLVNMLSEVSFMHLKINYDNSEVWMLMGNHEPVIAAKCSSEGKDPSIKHTYLTWLFTIHTLLTILYDTTTLLHHHTKQQDRSTKQDEIFTLCLSSVHYTLMCNTTYTTVLSHNFWIFSENLRNFCMTST